MFLGVAEGEAEAALGHRQVERHLPLADLEVAVEVALLEACGEARRLEDGGRVGWGNGFGGTL